MKFLVVLTVALVSVSADVSHLKSGDVDATILRSDYEAAPEGSFHYAYETSNGIAAQAEGVVKTIDHENAAVAIQGSSKYTAPDGTPIELTYIADENGYQPQGSHIPVPPPTPEAILRGLKYIADHPQPVERVAPIPVARANANVFG